MTEPTVGAKIELVTGEPAFTKRLVLFGTTTVKTRSSLFPTAIRLTWCCINQSTPSATLKEACFITATFLNSNVQASILILRSVSPSRATKSPLKFDGRIEEDNASITKKERCK